MNNKNIVIFITVILVATILVGEAAIYVKNPYQYDADAVYDEYGLEYTLESSNNSVYDVIALDNGDSTPVKELIICFRGDDSYLIKIKKELELRNFYNVIMVEPENLTEVMNEPEGKALLIPWGSFPWEIYNGTLNNPMMEWFDGGGSVFWFGYVPVEGYTYDNYLDPLGLSEDDFCTTENYAVSPSGTLCKELSLRNTAVYNGLKADTGTALAYVSDDGYSSITAKKVSNGTLIVFGGGQTYGNSMDCAQLISSGITADSVLAGHWSGTVKGSLTMSVLFDTEVIPENLSVYVYIGGYYIVYGKRC